MTPEELVQLERHQADNDFYYFSKHVYGNVDMEPHVHMDVCQALEDLEEIAASKRSVHAEGLFLMPRSTFKSHVITQAWTTWRAVRDPNLRILLTNENLAKSKDFLGHIKQVIETGEKFNLLYGNVRNDKKTGKPVRWREDGVTIAGRDQIVRESSFSIGAPGQTKTGMHYDIIVADDLVSERTVTTSEQIKKTLIYYRALQSLLDPGGILVVVGTRYNYDDLYGYLIENEIPDISIVKQAEDPETGELLFPERLTKDFLESMKKKLGGYMYSCQYMNSPVSDEDQVFLPENFRWVREDGDPLDTHSESIPDRVNRFLLVDMANTKTDESDYSALVGVAVDETNRIFVEYAEQRKVQSSELVDWIYSLDSQYCYDKIGIEQVGLADLMSLIQAGQRNGRRFIPCASVKTSTKISKHQRIRLMQPEHEAGMIFLRKHQKDLIDQMMRFPAIRKDDLIDALSMFKRVVYAPRAGEDKSEKRRQLEDVADHESWHPETQDHWAAWGYSVDWEDM